MLAKFLRFLKHPTSIDVIINTLGNYLNIFFTALFALILVRILSPAEYGVLSVLLGIAYVLANVLDFGTTATIYSYLPPLIEQRTENIYRFIKSMFFYQSLFSAIVIGTLFVTFPYLDKVFFKTEAPAWELYLTALSVLFFIWQNFIINCLFAAKRFLKANIYNNLANAAKTIVLFVLAITHSVSVGTVIFTFGIFGQLVFFLLLFIEKKDLMFVLLKSEVKREEFRFGYTLTYFVGSQFMNLGLRMDLFLLSFFKLRNDVGYYGLAQKIILAIITTIISITQVLSPAFSKVKTKVEIITQLKKAVMYLLLPSALFVILFITPNQIFYLFFTTKFAKTAAIAKALSLPFIIYTLINLPTLFLLYTVRKPGYILVSNVAFFLIFTFGCLYLIPKIGVFGPPYAAFAAFVVTGVIQAVAAIKEFSALPKTHPEFIT